MNTKMNLLVMASIIAISGIMMVPNTAIAETNQNDISLKAINEKFNGGPVGLNTLAAATGEEQSTIEDVIEPYLIRLGLLERTPRGRVLTPRGLSHCQSTQQ